MPRIPIVLALFGLLATGAPAQAQSETGAVVGGSVAAAVFGSGTEPSVTGAISYRFNRVVGFGIEATWVPTLRNPPAGLDSPYVAILYGEADGDAVFFTTNVKLEIPVQADRIVPFAVAGGGVASFTQSYAVSLVRELPTPQLAGVPTVVFPNLVPPPLYTSSSTGLMLTLGGGVSLLMSEHLALDIDLRTIYVHGEPSGAIGRFGVGASYRF